MLSPHPHCCKKDHVTQSWQWLSHISAMQDRWGGYSGECFLSDKRNHRRNGSFFFFFLPLDIDVSAWKAWNCSQFVILRALTEHRAVLMERADSWVTELTNYGAAFLLCEIMFPYCLSNFFLEFSVMCSSKHLNWYIKQVSHRRS